MWLRLMRVCRGWTWGFVSARRTGRRVRPAAMFGGLEHLEGRVLLSASSALEPEPVGVGEAGLSATIEEPLAYETVTTQWAGHTIEAIVDQWIIYYNPKKLNEAKIQRKLKQFGGLRNVTVTATSTPGVALLTAPMTKRARLQAFARRHAAVKVIEPNAVLELQVIPGDSRWTSLWGLHNTGQSGGLVDADIDAPEAWEITTGSRDVVIAVIDSGVDYNHPDLVANIWINPREIPGNGIDDDGNGFVDDVRGWNFIEENGNPMDTNGHGTHVAGTIGAVGNNGLGVVGVNWSVSILPLRFLGSDGRGSTLDAIQAVNYATMMKRDYGVNIVAMNNSWGGGGYSTSLRNAIQAAAAQDILFVAAAGNGDSNGVGINNDARPTYPSSYNVWNVIAVAATDRRDQLGSFSNYGATSVHLAAPGVSILSTVPNNGYATYTGTSMAAPHVSGVIGLLAAADPNATASQIKSAILNSVDPVASLTGRTVTGGRLNAYQALQALAPPPPPGQISGVVWHDADGDGQRDADETPLAGRTVFLDLNGNGVLDGASATFKNMQRVTISAFGTPTVSSSLVISGLGAAPITRVTLTLNITHTWVGDLEAYLISPSGTSVQLFSRIGGSGDHFINTTFDDAASTVISQHSAPFTGTFRPQEPLARFIGEIADGTWRLEVHDRANADGGAIENWTLNIWTAEPSQVTDSQGRYTFTLLAAGDYRVAQSLPAGWVQTWPVQPGMVQSLALGQLVQADFGSYALKPPTAKAGGTYTVKMGENLWLDGSGSFDADAVVGDHIVTYAWDLDGDGQFDDAAGAQPVVDWSTLQALGLGVAGTYTVRLRVTDSFGMTDEDEASVTIEPNAEVVGRYIFYNNSYHDGRNASANAADDGAIATDKQAYLPGNGPATFINYTSYLRGINGIMIDIANLPGDLSADDFIFRVGNSHDLSTWTEAPLPVSVTIRRGEGVGGSDRVTLIWADGAIRKQWLQVTVRANANTGLMQDDVFYFGNAIGETGNRTREAEVNALDMGRVRSNTSLPFVRVDVENVFDFNRDGLVDALDYGLARSHGTDLFSRLVLLDV